jgi:hypothetical protein
VRWSLSLLVVLLSSAVLVPGILAQGAKAGHQHRLTHGRAGIAGTVTVTGCQTYAVGTEGSTASTCKGDFRPASGDDALRGLRLAGSRVWLLPALLGGLLALIEVAVLVLVLWGPAIARSARR